MKKIKDLWMNYKTEIGEGNIDIVLGKFSCLTDVCACKGVNFSSVQKPRRINCLWSAWASKHSAIETTRILLHLAKPQWFYT